MHSCRCLLGRIPNKLVSEHAFIMERLGKMAQWKLEKRIDGNENDIHEMKGMLKEVGQNLAKLTAKVKVSHWLEQKVEETQCATIMFDVSRGKLKALSTVCEGSTQKLKTVEEGCE